MSVDTAAMREQAERHSRGRPSQTELTILLLSAAVEIDELREKVASQREAHRILIEASDASDAHYDGELRDTKQDLDAERAAHEQTKRELYEALSKTVDAREVLNAALEDLETSTGLQRKLATAVEALEWYASEIRWPAYSERARKALAAIRAQEKSATRPDRPPSQETECTCRYFFGTGVIDPNCPQHGREKR